MTGNHITVRIQVKLGKRRKLLLIALAAANKIIQLKTTQKVREFIIKSSIKVVPVKHEQSTTES